MDSRPGRACSLSRDRPWLQAREAFESGMIDHCSGVVGNAAGRAAEIILT